MARKVGLTRDRVLEEAMGLLDSGGAKALSLAALAQQLGVRTPSLYAHLPGGVGELRREMALQAASRIGRAMEGGAAGLQGREALAGVARAYRDFAHAHPGAYALAQVAVRPGEDDELYGALAATLTPLLRALAETGTVGDDAIHQIRILRSALHGFVLLEAGGGFGMPVAVEESFRRLVDRLSGPAG